jgi:hypothetical protein
LRVDDKVPVLMPLRETRDLRNNPRRELYPLAIVLRPATLTQIEALIAGDEVFAAQAGLRVIPGYLAFPEALEPMRRASPRGRTPTGRAI